ncbi:DUF4340 domain-containing protein [Bradyrhizobium sp. RDM12]
MIGVHITRSIPRWSTPFAAAVLIGLLAMLVISGKWPELRSKVAFSGKGVVAIDPAEIRRVEIRAGSDSLPMMREASGWTIEALPASVPPEVARHLETALRLIHVSESSREIAPDELTPPSFAAFGLDPPLTVAVLESKQGDRVTVNFGGLNPASTAHYVRVAGRPTVYLMPRHVAEEWRVTLDMARRLVGRNQSVAARGKDLLLPMSITQAWAIEIVFAGKLTRFERDPAGSWFRHLGQHSHSTGTAAHVADPAQAEIIDAALRAFDSSAVETRVGPATSPQLERYGLTLPGLILLLYARDNSTPLARVEFGAASDSLDRYARLAPDGEVATVAEFEAKRLTDLLRAVGGAPEMRRLVGLAAVLLFALVNSQAHQMNLVTARVALGVDRAVSVELALKGATSIGSPEHRCSTCVVTPSIRRELRNPRRPFSPISMRISR